MTGRIRRIAAAAAPRGDVHRLRMLIDLLNQGDADAFVLLGDLTGDESKPEDYRAVLKALGAARVPSYWVPGPTDAPLGAYLRESYNIEMALPLLHGVHGTLALAADYTLFAGLGGEIVDDPDAEREEQDALRYPGWEVEYRLKVLRELAHDYQKVFLFTTAPAHKGLDHPGSEVLAELIKTHRPRVALVAGGDGFGHELLARTLVVFPGTIAAGEYALVDVHDRKVTRVKFG
jgi:Icc-related predicted phosphoesterase